MPTEQPSSAPDDQPPTPKDADTVANVLNDDALDKTPGGGGLGGGSGAMAGGTHGAGGPSRNAPVDTGVDAGEANAAAEARTQAADANAPEPHPSSQ